MKTFSDYGIDVGTRRGIEVKTTCPQCSPSRKKSRYPCLSVNTEKGVWHCFHCGWSGGLAKGIEHRPQITKTYRKPDYVAKASGLHDTVVSWFAERGITEEVLRRNQIGVSKMYFPQVEEERPCVSYPYLRGSDVVNVKYRTRDKLFRMESGCERVLYGLNDIAEMVVWVEGECFPGDAEILTDGGWVRFDAYVGGRVAQVDADLNVGMVSPVAHVRKWHTGDLVLFEKGGNYRSLTTPGHQLVIEQGGKLTKRAAGDMPINVAGRIPRCGIMNGQGIDLSDDQIRLCIAIHADASIREKNYRSRYAVFGFRKARKAERLREILYRLGLHYSDTKIANGYDSLCLHVPDWVVGKRFPIQWLFDATAHQRNLILDELIEWDGNRVKDRPQTEFSSAHKSEAEWVQTMAHLAGKVATVHERSNAHGKWFKTNILNTKRSTFWQFMEPKRVPHDGMVYCLQVPTGMLLVRQGGHITITGNCDKLSLEVAGITSCVSVPDGAPTPDTKHYESKFDFMAAPELERARIHVIAVDNDAPGIRLREELVRRLGPENCLVVHWPDGCKDANDVLVTYGASVLADCIRDAQPLPIVGAHDVSEYADELKQLYEFGSPRGTSTGWSSVDDCYTVRPGDMTVITGIPNSGKSEWMDALLVNLARNTGWSFGVFSPENHPVPEHIKKIAEKYIGKPFEPGFNERMTPSEWDMAQSWINQGFTFIDTEEPSLDAILDVARQLVKRKGIRGLVIDPWNEVEHVCPVNMSETNYISQCLSKIRRFARNHGVHVWIIAHPTKLFKDKEGNYPVPSPYDISGSANWRNKADNCITVWRDLDPEARDAPVEIHLQKVRHKVVGKIGMAKLRYDRIAGRYFEMPDVIDAYARRYEGK